MSGTRAVSSTPTRSSQESNENEPLSIKCDCGLEAARFVSNTKANPDRAFFKCSVDECKFWKWADQISGSSFQSGSRTPSSSQPRPSQTSPPPARTPAQSPTKMTSPIKTAWTTQGPLPAPLSANRSKRKRSTSPTSSASRSPSLSPSTPYRGGNIGANRDPNRNTGPFGNAVASSSRAPPRGSPNPSPKKRAKRDNGGGSTDEELWLEAGDVPIDIFTGRDENKDDEELVISSAQRPLKKSVSFHEGSAGGRANGEEQEVVQAEARVARRLDFSSMRAPASAGRNAVRGEVTENFPIVDNDPSNPFFQTPSTTPGRQNGSNSNITPGTNRYAPVTPSTVRSDTTTPGSVRTPGINGDLGTAEHLAVLSQIAEFLPQLQDAIPALQQRFTTLERKRTADSKSIDARSRRIKTLEGEKQALEDENENLRAENERLGAQIRNNQ